MPFHSYQLVADVARAHRLRVRRESFLEPVGVAVSDHFLHEIEFSLEEISLEVSEAILCEALIFPWLREIWKPYREELSFWSHLPLRFDDDLCGVPDYCISRRSPLGKIVPDQPYILVVEAKRDDPTRGWGQCLAAMLAAQRLDELPERSHFGIATNGRNWEFGRLDGEDFVQERRTFSIQEPDDLAAALNAMMLLCREQAARPLATA